MPRFLRANFSLTAYFLCAALMLFACFKFYPRWKQAGFESNIAYDTEGYYWYLPSLFIYENLKTQQYPPGVLEHIQASKNSVFENGFPNSDSSGFVLKYSSGMAVLYSPGFFAGHVAAKLLHYPQDGFSPPYKLAFQIWAIIFALTGLYFFRKLLLLFFSDWLVGWGLLLLVFGTNYLNYAAIDGGMSHAWLFCLYVYLMWASYFFYTRNKGKYLVIAGALTGLMVLVRPTEIIACLVPLLWGVENVAELKARFRLLWHRRLTALGAALAGFMIISVQLCYWKYVSGNWVVYSYQDQGFNFLRPHAIVYSWSYRAGWLRYSPMMLFAYAGLLIYFKGGKNKWMIYVLAILNYYIVSAWNIWDYGGFSGRAMIQSYPILFFPFLHFMQFCLRHKVWKYVFIAFVGLFLYLNIWWTYQAHWGGLADAFLTTKEYYLKIVGRWSVPEEYQKLKDTPELLEMPNPSFATVASDSGEYCVDTDHENADKIFALSNKELPYKWIRVAAVFSIGQKEWSAWLIPQLIVSFRAAEKDVKVNMIRTHRFLDDNSAEELFIDVRVPSANFSELKVSLWNAESDKRTCMRNITVSGLTSESPN